MSETTLPPITAYLQANISDFQSKMEKADRESSGHFGSIGKGMASSIGHGTEAAVVAVIAFGAASLGTFEKVAGETAKMQRITGESAETMSRLRFAAEETGVSSESLSKGFVKLAKDVSGNNKALAEYHIATKDANGNALSMNDVLGNTAEVFKNMPNGIDKTALAVKLFGKAGTDMIPLLNKGKDGLAELGAESDKFGLTIGQGGVDAMKANVMAHRQMHAAWEGLQVQLGAHLMPIVAKITTWLASNLPAAMAFVTKAVHVLTPAFEEVGRVIGEFVDFVRSVVAEFQAGGISGVFKMLEEKWREAWPKIEAFLGQAAEKLWTWIKDAVPPMLAEAGKLLEALGSWLIDTALPAIGNQLAAWGSAFWAWVQPQIIPLLKELGSLLESLGKWLIDTALPAIGDKLLEWGKAFWAWVGPKIAPMLEELGKLLVRLGEWLLNTALPAILDKLGHWAAAFIAWVGPQIPPLLVELGKLLLRLGDWILTTALPAVLDKLGHWAAAFIEWVVPAAASLVVEMGKLGVKFLGWIVDQIPGIALKVYDWGVALFSWVGDLVGQIPGKLAGIGHSIFTWIGGLITDIGTKFSGIASAIGAGIINTIKGAWNAVADWWNSHVAGVGFSVPSWIPGFGGDSIRAPSLPHLAIGGIVTESGLAMVGERGAEVVRLPKGAEVYPHGTGPADHGGGGVSYTFNSYGITDHPALARTQAREMAWAMKIRAA